MPLILVCLVFGHENAKGRGSNRRDLDVSPGRSNFVKLYDAEVRQYIF